jgi:hypothetical protein
MSGIGAMKPGTTGSLASQHQGLCPVHHSFIVMSGIGAMKLGAHGPSRRNIKDCAPFITASS